jgi:hypothetical protein
MKKRMWNLALTDVKRNVYVTDRRSHLSSHPILDSLKIYRGMTFPPPTLTEWTESRLGLQ